MATEGNRDLTFLWRQDDHSYWTKKEICPFARHLTRLLPLAS
jgi:hypothetical protein